MVESAKDKAFAVLMTEQDFELFKQQDATLFSHIEYFRLDQEPNEIRAVPREDDTMIDQTNIFEMLPEAEAAFEKAAKTINEAVLIEKSNTSRLNAMTRQIEDAVKRLNTTLGKSPSI